MCTKTCAQNSRRPKRDLTHPTRSRLRFFRTHDFILSSNFTRGVSEILALEPRFHRRQRWNLGSITTHYGYDVDLLCLFISEKKKEGREARAKARQRKRKTEKGGALLAAPLLDQSSYDVVMN